MAALKISLGFVAACATLVAASPTPCPGLLPMSTKTTCGYESCPVPKEGMMNVHLIPHTHDDVGWLKTVDQYFYGHRNEIQMAGVQYIIDSVINELPKDPSRRFIYVETAYLRQWWDQQPESIREITKGLIESGQLEIISGGWSMHDEAVTHYHSIIDQFSWGFKNIDEMFGTSCARPHIGWQVDPFGHARETASLMAMMGFDALFFARLDEADKQNRLKNKEMELVWKSSANHGGSSYLFTSAFHDFYYPPAGYCFDILCSDDPIIDDERSPDYNVGERVKGFIDYINKQGQYFTTNNILVPMGTDFSYQQAGHWYKNLDKLIKYVNMNGSMNLMYSTPSCYLKAVHGSNKNWTSKEDDFFPYSSDDHSYWTGYFTSRPTLKFMERKGNNFLQVCKQLSVLASVREERWEDLSSLREAMGIMQHHDAITGTEKQHVAEDYALRLHNAMLDCHNTTGTALNKLAAIEEAGSELEFKSCLYSNISACDVSQNNDMFIVTVYNPLSQNTSMFVRLPVQDFVYQVFDGMGTKLETQMLKIPSPVLDMPGRSDLSEATQELVFRATDIPALGFKNFHVSKTDQASPVPVPDQTFSISNEKLVVMFDDELHRLDSVKDIATDITYSVTQDFVYYEAVAGDNIGAQNRASGAYIFRPVNQQKIFVSSDPPEVEVFTGPLVSEVHQIYNEWVSMVTRLYKDQEEIEMEWVVGPIPIDDDTGKEVVSLFKVSGWQTNATFFTDSNGRETLKRVRNYRPTWEVDPNFEPVSSNYYPITTAISLRNLAENNKNEEFVVVTDRAQGGSSIDDGDLEIMLHRRLLFDDDKGVAEALNETTEFDGVVEGLVARGKQIVFFGQTAKHPTSMYRQRKIARDSMVLYPWVFLSPTTQDDSEWTSAYKTEFTGLSIPVPDNVNILTLEPWGDDILVRVEHFLETNDDPILSAEAHLAIRGLIEKFTDDRPIVETTLGGNQEIYDSSRLEFKLKGEDEMVSQQVPRPVDGESRSNITLKPMQIRTFIVKSGAFAIAPQAIHLIALLSISLWKIFG